MNRLFIVEATLCVGLSLFVAGCERKVTAQDKRGGQHRSGAHHRGTRPGRQQLQGGSSRSSFRWRRRASTSPRRS